MQYVDKRLGFTLPLVDQDQARVGRRVMGEQRSLCDAVSFADATGLAHHDGLHIGNGSFIRSPHTTDVVEVSSLASSHDANRYTPAPLIVPTAFGPGSAGEKPNDADHAGRPAGFGVNHRHDAKRRRPL